MLKATGLVRFVVGVLLVAASSSASGQESPWILRGYAAYVEPAEELSGREAQLPELVFNVAEEIGFGLALEYRFTRRWGLELASIYSRPEVKLVPCDICSSGRERLNFVPLTLGLYFNLLPGRGADLYLGPVVGYVFYGGFPLFVADVGRFATFNPKDDRALGASVGADLPVGERWRVHLALRYLDTTVQPTSGGAVVDLNPTIVTFGFAWR